MTSIRYGSEQFDVAEDETLLEALLRQGATLPYSCRQGTCQTCLMRAVSGTPPAEAQKGLKETLKARQCFLACVCKPGGDMEVVLPGDFSVFIQARVSGLRALSADILEVALETAEPFDYHPGQFIHLRNPDGVGRSYSLASVPGLDEGLRLQVRRLPQGQVSGWIHDRLRVGDPLELSGPLGDCFYLPGRFSQPLLLVGTGSGLAPLYGLVRQALMLGHQAPVCLFHGSREPEGLYLVDELRALAGQYSQFYYTACLSGADKRPGYAEGRVEDVAFSLCHSLDGWRVFLCGHPGMVNQARLRAFRAGALLQDIYADPFHASH